MVENEAEGDVEGDDSAEGFGFWKGEAEGDMERDDGAEEFGFWKGEK